MFRIIITGTTTESDVLIAWMYILSAFSVGLVTGFFLANIKF